MCAFRYTGRKRRKSLVLLADICNTYNLFAFPLPKFEHSDASVHYSRHEHNLHEDNLSDIYKWLHSLINNWSFVCRNIDTNRIATTFKNKGCQLIWPTRSNKRVKTCIVILKRAACHLPAGGRRYCVFQIAFQWSVFSYCAYEYWRQIYFVTSPCQ
jgi:hypothetical protein